MYTNIPLVSAVAYAKIISHTFLKITKPILPENYIYIIINHTNIVNRRNSY